MKTIVLYYSRTGVTDKAAKRIAKDLNADIEEIKDKTKRSGAIGYIRSGRDASLGKRTDLHPLKSIIADYDLVVLGTPIWAWTVSTPIKTFIEDNKKKIKNTAFFCTMGGNNPGKTFAVMTSLVGKEPISTISIRTKDVQTEDISPFIASLTKQSNKKKTNKK